MLYYLCKIKKTTENWTMFKKYDDYRGISANKIMNWGLQETGKASFGKKESILCKLEVSPPRFNSWFSQAFKDINSPTEVNKITQELEVNLILKYLFWNRLPHLHNSRRKHVSQRVSTNQLCNVCKVCQVSPPHWLPG